MEKQGKDTLVASFQKNALETVKIKLTEYKGKKVIDLRVWVKDLGNKEEIPTHKGLTIGRELFGELNKGIQELGRTLR